MIAEVFKGFLANDILFKGFLANDILLSLLVGHSLFWCSGSWNLTSRQFSKIRGLQQDMLHKMVRLRRPQGENIECFMERLNSKIMRIKLNHSFEDWDQRVKRNVFSWAGHVAHMASYDANRLTHRVLQHKSWKWIQRVAAANSGNQLHHRNLKIWRWERPLYNFFKPECWQTVAQDTTVWKQRLDELLNWRRMSR